MLMFIYSKLKTDETNFSTGLFLKGSLIKRQFKKKTPDHQLILGQVFFTFFFFFFCSFFGRGNMGGMKKKS